MNANKRLILGIILFGSIWGGLEALGIEAMRTANFHPSSPILALIAILLLASARMVFPRAGTTILIALVAAGFKFLSLPSVYFCQLCAVLLTGVVFDLTFTLAERKGWIERLVTLGVVGLVASYINYLAFAFSEAYLFFNPYWTERGVAGLLRWVYTDGSYAAALSFFGIMIGVGLGRRLAPRFLRWQNLKEKAYARGLILTSLGFWLLGLVLYS
ncbi:MAG: hypothetical protein AMJ41_02790 [candidate division Zixibacteria bacterium DG_27]|nr:MAG: hypothetical protein AMJ41_02790 [candidate division Zixibacteria bacterium DG_27]